MAETTRQPDESAPSYGSAMEKAEGSREYVEDARGSEHGAGITNRPVDEEREEQESLPPRATRKDDDSHA